MPGTRQHPENYTLAHFERLVREHFPMADRCQIRRAAKLLRARHLDPSKAYGIYPDPTPSTALGNDNATAAARRLGLTPAA